MKDVGTKGYQPSSERGAEGLAVRSCLYAFLKNSARKQTNTVTSSEQSGRKTTINVNTTM